MSDLKNGLDQLKNYGITVQRCTTVFNESKIHQGNIRSLTRSPLRQPLIEAHATTLGEDIPRMKLLAAVPSLPTV